MQADYMFAVQEICINLIYIPPAIKKENHAYTWLKMIVVFFVFLFQKKPNQQWSVSRLDYDFWKTRWIKKKKTHEQACFKYDLR